MSINKEEIIDIVRDYHYELDKHKDFSGSIKNAFNKIEKLVGLEYVYGEEIKRREKSHSKEVMLNFFQTLINNIKCDLIIVNSIETKTPPQEYCSPGTGRLGYEPGPDQFITIHTSKKENV